MAFYVLVCR